MKTWPSRVVVYAKDIVTLTGRSERTAQRLLQKIRKLLGKNNDQYITIEEFCRFTGFKEEELKKIILGLISFIVA
jgi:hypothetical protein